MSVYSELIDEMGFDPTAPGPEVEHWQPWSMRGTWEIILGRTDLTVWTVENARQLTALLQVPVFEVGKGDGSDQAQ